MNQIDVPLFSRKLLRPINTLLAQLPILLTKQKKKKIESSLICN